MMGRGVSSRTAAVGLLTLCVGALEPVIFVKLHRVGGTTLQNLLVRHAVNRNRTVLCTHMVASFNPGSLKDLEAKALAGDAPSNTGRWPLDLWVHHVALIKELDRAIPFSAARVVTVVRSPERRFESAWAVFTSRSVDEGRAKGWGMGVYGLTAGDYCANVTASPDLLAAERLRRSTHVALDGMSRALLGLTHQDRREPSAKRLDKLFAAVRDGSVFAVVNERYDESLLRLAADYGLEGDDLIHSSYQRRTSADSHVVLGDTRRERLRHDAQLASALSPDQRNCLRAAQPNDVELVRSANAHLDATKVDTADLAAFEAASAAATAYCTAKRRQSEGTIDPQCQLLQRAVATLNQKVQVPDHVKRAFADRLCPSPRSPRGSAKADPDYVPVFRDADVRRAVAGLDAALARLRRRSHAPRLSLSRRTGSPGGSLRF